MSRLLFAAVAVIAFAYTANAQQPPTAPTQTQPIKRTLLQKYDVPGTKYQIVVGIAEIAPNVNIDKHTHTGPESAYMLEGEMTLMVDGQPPAVIKTGNSYKVPAGVAHDAKTGANGAKGIGVYVVEKGKPLASPAP